MYCGLMYGLHSRATSNQERPMMARSRYLFFFFWDFWGGEGRQTSSFQTVWTLGICQTSRRVMSNRTLLLPESGRRGGISTYLISSLGPVFRCLQVSMEDGFFRNGHVVFFLSSYVSWFPVVSSNCIKLCDQFPSLSLSRWKTLTLLKI